MWHALRTLASRSAIFDIPLLNALRWWESVFRACLRKTHVNLLKGDATHNHKRGSNDGSSSSVIQPSMNSDCGSDTAAESKAGEQISSDTDVCEEDMRTSLKLPIDALHYSNNSAPGDMLAAEQSDEVESTEVQKGHPLNETSALADCASPRGSPAANARNMIEFAARQLPENEFCLALIQSVSLWFDQPSDQLLVAAFHMSLAAGKGLEQPGAASLLCDALSQCCPTLQLRISLAAQDMFIADKSNSADHGDAGPSDEIGQQAGEWLNSQLLGALGWLECHVRGLRGLHDQATRDPVSFYRAAMHSQPFNNLPPPFNRLSSFQRLLLALALQPDATHATLEGYITTSMQQLWPSGLYSKPAPLDSAARIAQALQSDPSGYCPILLHANVPHAAVNVVYSLLSIHRCGTFLLNAPTSRTLQLLATETKTTPRRAQTSLVVVSASQHLHALALMQTVRCAAAEGHWVLLSCAHLRPDLIPGVVRLALMLQDNISTSPYFRLFMSCPSISLPTIPLRSSMLSIMCGDDQQGRASYLLRAADSPLGDRLPLIPSSPAILSQVAPGRTAALQPVGSSATAGTAKSSASTLSPPQLLLLQTLAVRAAVAIAQVEDRMRSNSTHAAFLCTPVPLITARDFVHALWCIHETILLAPDSRKLRMGELQAAIVQVSILHACLQRSECG